MPKVAAPKRAEKQRRSMEHHVGGFLLNQLFSVESLSQPLLSRCSLAPAAVSLCTSTGTSSTR